MRLHEFFGQGENLDREASVTFTRGCYRVQCWDGTTSFCAGEYETEEAAEMAAENYVLGRNPQWVK